MVFVIEDDRGWEDYYRNILSRYELKCFHDGVAAVNEMNEVRPDAIILDIMLNGPTGFAVLNEMQSYPDLASVPIIVVSSVDNLDKMALRKYGVVQVLDKSKMHPRELLGALEAVLTAKTNQEAHES